MVEVSTDAHVLVALAQVMRDIYLLQQQSRKTEENPALAASAKGTLTDRVQ